MPSVDLHRYLSVLWKWSWLIALATGLSAFISYRSLRHVPPIYTSSTTIQVGDLTSNPNPNGGDFSTAQSLASAYAQTAQQEPILAATVKALKLPMSWQQLRGQVLVIHSYGSQTIEIRAEDGNPRRAQQIAAGVAEQLIASSPTAKNRAELAARRQFISQELDDLQKQIDQAKAQEKQKSAEMAVATSARDVLDRQDEIKALELNIGSWQTTYASLLKTLEGGNGPNDLTVIEPASYPIAPAGPNTKYNVAFAGLAGFLLAASGILFLEYLDDTVKKKGDLEAILGVPTLGAILRTPSLGRRVDPLPVSSQPESASAESYRSLAVNLRFVSVGQPNPTLLITSGAPREGKSTTAANLAIALAQSGKTVLLVDLDLRNPTLHSFFGIANDSGITRLLLNAESRASDCVVETRVPGLRLLPAGPVDQVASAERLIPAEALSRFGEQLIQEVRGTADFVIVDSPPLLAASDAVILAALVDGILLVARAGQTRRGTLQVTREALERTGTRLFGAILNAAGRGEVDPYGYGYYPKKRKGALGLRLLRREKGA